MKYKKYVRMVATVVLCMICVTGCDKDKVAVDEGNNNVAVTITPQPTIEVTPTPVISDLDSQKELSIYSIDSQSAEKISVTALVSSEKEVTPQMIVDKVAESMVDETLVIGIDSVTTQEDTVIVSFLDDQAPVTGVGSPVESEILDAIAQSLLDNLENYHKVIFRVMGGAYKSDHMDLGINTVYLKNE